MKGERFMMFTEEDNKRFFEMDLKVAKLQEDMAKGMISDELARELKAEEEILRMANLIDAE